MSTVKQTKFCHAEINLTGGFVLHVDGNQKITAGNGTYAEPAPNAFSLAHIDDCPGSTAACRASCYVHGLKGAVPELYELYEHNSREIRRILAADGGIDQAREFGMWIAEHCRGGFRWHVSGDVFCVEYARWIVAVTEASPHVTHWIYTRSFDVPGVLDELERAGNLTVNISADANNYGPALVAAREKLASSRLCYMSTLGEVPPDLEPGDVVFPDYKLRSQSLNGLLWFDGLTQAQKRKVCPVDFFGKSETSRCGVCRKCIDP